MTRNFCSKNISRKMEVEVCKLNESQLSSAYINRVAKKLNSSRPEDPMEAKSRGKASFCKISRDHSKDRRFLNESQQESKSTSVNSPIPKKQVRRRLHTSKPYQERLLNMAEARREIVTALKLHRATMKHATEQQKFQQQEQQQQHQNPSPSQTLELSPAVLGEIQEFNENRINFTTHPFNYTISNHLQNTNSLHSEYHSFPWMHLPITPIRVHENLNITCHNHPLGFYPNLQSFNNRNNTFGDKLHWKSTMQPSSQPTSSTSSSPESIMPSFQASCLSKSSCHASCDALDLASRAFHPRMDADEIAQIHLIGEQHDMEWNDKMNMMASAWWSKFLRNMDDGFCACAGGEKIGSHMSDGFCDGAEGEKIGTHMSDEEFNMLSCLSNGNAREPCLLEQCMWNYYNEEDYLPDATFPW